MPRASCPQSLWFVHTTRQLVWQHWKQEQTWANQLNWGHLAFLSKGKLTLVLCLSPLLVPDSSLMSEVLHKAAQTLDST